MGVTEYVQNQIVVITSNHLKLLNKSALFQLPETGQTNTYAAFCRLICFATTMLLSIATNKYPQNNIFWGLLLAV